MVDRYTKAVLTVIAVALVTIAVQRLRSPLTSDHLSDGLNWKAPQTAGFLLAASVLGRLREEKGRSGGRS